MAPDELRLWLRSTQETRSRAPLVMGVLNITPDSFSDGGVFQDAGAAVAQAAGMVGAGADLIDIGGESTRPGSTPVSAAEQVRRVMPVIAAIRQNFSIGISIDTTIAAVAAAALDAGANWINDISAGWDDPDMFALVAKRRAPIILMHMQGKPATMQENPTYRNVTVEVSQFLSERVDSAKTAGIDPADVLIDPGIGFGKTVEHNLQLLRNLDRLVGIGQPVVIGTSRKGFIARITGETEPGDRLMGTAATVAWAAANGAGIVRVHDVEPIVRIVRMIEAIRTSGGLM